MTWFKKNKIIIFKVWLCIFLSLGFSSGHIENPDTHLRLTQAINLVNNNTISIPKGIGNVTHGNIAYDKNGTAYSVYNPGQIVLFTPIVYAIQKINIEGIDSYYIIAFFVSFLNYAVLGLIGCLLFEFGNHFKISFKKNISCILTFVFTSYCFAHSQDSYEHIYEGLFILLSFFYALKLSKTKQLKYLLLTSISIGIGLIFRTTTVLVIPGILILIKNWKNRLYLLTFIFPFFTFFLRNNYFRFDNILNNGYSDAWELAFNKSAGTAFSTLNIPKHIFGFIFSPTKGLLFFSPSIILGIFGWILAPKTLNRLLISVCITVFLYLIIYGANFAWHGSAWCWGPRYIIPIIPLVYLGIFFFFSKKTIFFSTILIAVSFSVQILSTCSFYKRQLVKDHISNGDIYWSDQYFYTFKFFSLRGQLNSFQNVISKREDELFLYLPSNSWKNESRPASQEMMLKNSVDFNSMNYWWARIQYLNSEFNGLKFISIILVSVLLLFGCFITIFIYATD